MKEKTRVITGEDGTVRRFAIKEVLEYRETLCSYLGCSKWFTAPTGTKARFHSHECRREAQNDVRRAKAQASNRIARRGDSRAVAS